MPTTANMTLVLPTVSSTIGPDWATLLNAALTLVDSHDHSTGKGVKVTPAGLNINANLDYNDAYAINVGSLRLTSQSSNLSTPSDIGALYSVNGNLWWNNDAGTQVQLTSGGSTVAATDGIARAFSRSAVSSNTIISGASSVSFFDVDTTTSVTFTLPAANAVTAGRFYEFKDTTGSAGTNNIVINRAGADTIDGATSFTIANNYGGIRLVSDGNSKWLLSRNVIDTAQIRDSAITTAKLNNGAVTQAKRAALGEQLSASSGTFSTTSTSYVDVTNLSVTITTTGRPVFIGLVGDGSGNSCKITNERSADSMLSYPKIVRGSTDLNIFTLQTQTTGSGTTSLGFTYPPSAISTIDTPAAGTYTYKVQTFVNAGTTRIEYAKLLAYEL